MVIQTKLELDIGSNIGISINIDKNVLNSGLHFSPFWPKEHVGAAHGAASLKLLAFSPSLLYNKSM